jgi:hypothetical protein
VRGYLAALLGWVGLLDNITLDWIESEDLDLDDVTGLCVQALRDRGGTRRSRLQQFLTASQFYG